jgi:hypothetical protein
MTAGAYRRAVTRASRPQSEPSRASREPRRHWLESGVAILVWQLFLLLPTVAFKHAYVEAIWHRNGLWSAGAAALAGPRSWPLNALRIFRSDILLLAAGAAIAWFVGVRLLRLPQRSLMLVTVLATLVCGGVSWLSVHETDAMLTPEVARIAWHWVSENPGIVLRFHPYRIAVLVGVGLGWMALLAWLMRRPDARSWRRHALHAVGGAAALLIVAALLAGPGPVSRAPDAQLARRSLWASVALAFTGGEVEPPLPRPPTFAELQRRIQRATYPRGAPAAAPMLVTLPPARARRHVILILLETAPRKYYPLADNPDFPTFAAMSRQGIVSDRHYTTRPFSTEASFSAVNGLYPRAVRDLERAPGLVPDGLGVVLTREGYETTYIDSYRLDWLGGDTYRRLLTGFGFAHLVETYDSSEAAAGEASYPRKLASELQAFRSALASIDSATRHRRKALVVMATALGHFDWQATAAHRLLPAASKVYELARVNDRLVGGLLQGLKERGLADSVLIVVTGDHGLRYREEFTSLGEERQAGVSFNVPFLLYAPGLLPHEVRLPYVTSHVDIAPTLLALDGVPTDHLAFHGGDMLDSTLASRAVFLLNERLAPFDYVWWRDGLYEHDHITGRIQLRKAPPAGAALPPGAVRAMLDSAMQVFDLTAAYFTARGRR